jgi:hypothetical protein
MLLYKFMSIVNNNIFQSSDKYLRNSSFHFAASRSILCEAFFMACPSGFKCRMTRTEIS